MATQKSKKDVLALVRSNILYLRNSKGWSQYEMAAELKMTRAVIAGWEKTQSTSIPKPNTLAPVAKYFKITAEDILTIDLSKEMPKSTPEVKLSQEKRIADLEKLNAALTETIDLQRKYIGALEQDKVRLQLDATKLQQKAGKQL
jgi:transcriptional regulator with XRE-family HTH domain